MKRNFPSTPPQKGDEGGEPSVQDMEQFMGAIWSVDSQGELEEKLSNLGLKSKMKKCFGGMWSYMYERRNDDNGHGMDIPDWLQKACNDVVSGLLSEAAGKFKEFEKTRRDLECK